MTASQGTSPREWGKPAPGLGGDLVLRNIPTRVGKTSPVAFTPMSVAGTSPREWGKLILSVALYLVYRNIPTRVGKTGFGWTMAGTRLEHPHASGENAVCKSSRHWQFGTSPREWGKPVECAVTDEVDRNIPTRVGKTSSRRRA